MSDQDRLPPGIFRLEMTRTVVADYLAIKEEVARRMMDFPLDESPFTIEELTRAIKVTIDTEKLLEALDREIAAFYANEFEAIRKGGPA